MRIAIVSQYFPPELGATQNRIGTFAAGLADRGHDVTVICEQPNHPSGVFEPGFGGRPAITERSNGTTVRRVWVATSPQKTTIRRLGFYVSFALGASALVALERDVDVMFASSPPLPGPLAAAMVARARRIPFVLDVRDLWPAAAEALGELSNRQLLWALERGERWLYRSAAAVTATTAPFCAHIDRVVARSKSVLVPNGALDELLEVPAAPAPSSTPFVVGYTGNLGIAQGLSIVFDAAERLQERDVRFVLVGAGPLTHQLHAERARRGLTSVEIRPPMHLPDLAAFMQSCHALLVPLGSHPLLADFVPSKLYDAMAIGRPVIVAAAGEAPALVQECRAGLTVPPEDGEALAEAVLTLKRDPQLAASLGEAGREAAKRHVRSNQLDRLEQILLEAAASSNGDGGLRRVSV